MKIIQVDNFDRETVAEVLVAENIQSQEHADVMLAALRTKCFTLYGSAWYRIVPDDHKLWGGMKELV